MQTQEGRAGAAHVGAAGEQAGADGAAGGTHEAVEGKTLICVITLILDILLHGALWYLNSKSSYNNMCLIVL